MKIQLILAVSALVVHAQAARVPRSTNAKYDEVLDELREVARRLDERRHQGEPEAREIPYPYPNEFVEDNDLGSEEAYNPDTEFEAEPVADEYQNDNQRSMDFDDPYRPVEVEDYPAERRNMDDNDLYRREEEVANVQYQSDEDVYSPVDLDPPQYGDLPSYGQSMDPVDDLQESPDSYVNSDPFEDLNPEERDFDQMQYRSKSEEDSEPAKKPETEKPKPKKPRCFGCKVTCNRGGDLKASTCGGDSFCHCWCRRFRTKGRKIDVRARCY